MKRIRPSQWPVINNPGDVDPARDQLRTIRDQSAARQSAYNIARSVAPFPIKTARNAHGQREQSRIKEWHDRWDHVHECVPDLGYQPKPGRGPAPPAGLDDLLDLVDQIIEEPDRVDPETVPVGADDYGTPPTIHYRTLGITGLDPHQVDPRPFAALAANRKGLDQLRADRRDGDVQRSEITSLADHIENTLVPAVAAELARIRPRFDEITAAINEQFAAAERGYWDWSGLPAGAHDTPEPAPIEPAQLRPAMRP